MITVGISPDEFHRTTVPIRGDKYRHLFRARRLPQGSEIRVIDGLGRARWARVEAVEPSVAYLELGEKAPANEPLAEVRLFVAPPKPQRLATLVEKVTELGARSIHLMTSDRTNRSITTKELARLGRIALSAVEQSHRALIPEIEASDSLETALLKLTNFDCLWLLDPEAELSDEKAVGPKRAIVVGPEGGFNQYETDLLVSLGARRIGLGPRILRTETAAIVGVTALLYCDLRS